MGMWLFKLAVLTAALYGLYHTTLRGNTFFHFNRRFLVGGMLLAVLLPFVPFVYEPQGSGWEGPVAENVFQIGPLVTIQVHTRLAVLFGKIFTCLYGMGVVVLLLSRYTSIRSLRRLIKEGKRTRFSRFTLIEHPAVSSSFSYIHSIILPDRLNEKDKKVILMHEQVHVLQRHYIDLFASELFCILQWFNPFAWLYKRDLVENHEFLADRAACRACGVDAYKETLTGCWLYGTGKNLVNPFARSTRLMRFCMLTKPISPALRKVGAFGVIPLVALYACLFAVPASQAVLVSASEKITVMGTVSSATGRKLTDACVVIPGRAEGTLSDVDGRFQLSACPGDTLWVQMPGYEKQHFRVGDDTAEKGKMRIDIILQSINR